MKRMFIFLAKIIVMGFWLGSIYFTFFHPLTGKIHTLIPVFAVLVLLVHGIQAAIMTLVAKDLVKLSRLHHDAGCKRSGETFPSRLSPDVVIWFLSDAQSA